MGVKYKKTNIAPWIAASNISSVSINAPIQMGQKQDSKV